MPVDDSAVGRWYPAVAHEVGREQIREYANAIVRNAGAELELRG